MTDPREIALTLEFDEDQVSGELSEDAAHPRRFTSWLGLLSLLEGLRSAPDDSRDSSA